MSSTFFGLSIAASGLNTSQAQLNTTANNIANVRTNGYSRQTVNTVASSALRCYQSYGTTGTGVEAVSVTQYRDLYYDEKYWNNQSALGYYEKKLYYMDQIQSYFSEVESSSGFSSIYAKMFNSMSTLQSNPGDLNVRREFISKAKELTEYFNSTAGELKELQSSINDEIKTAVNEMNSIAEKIAILNKQINVIEQANGYANELRDQRALLIDELSEYVTVDTQEIKVTNSNNPDMETGATYFRVSINGQLFVDTYEFTTLACKARGEDEAHNLSDIGGLYDIVWEEDGNTFNATGSIYSGSLKAMFEIRDGNNAENLKGKVESATANSITIKGVNITDINELNLPPSGMLTTNNTNYKYDSFTWKTGEDNDGNTIITSVTFNLDQDNLLTNTTMKSLTGKRLEVGSTVDFMGIPYYQNQMNNFVRSFAEKFNDIERSGVDAEGEDMDSFFIANDKVQDLEHKMNYDCKNNTVGISSSDETYYLLNASNFAVNKESLKYASKFAVTTGDHYSDGQDSAVLVNELLLLQTRTKIFRGGGGDKFLQCIYADVTVDAQECEIFTQNYQNIKETISEQRQSVSGVDEDEEALDLIKFQNAYNLSSKCISVFTEIYDRLILQTGV